MALGFRGFSDHSGDVRWSSSGQECEEAEQQAGSYRGYDLTSPTLRELLPAPGPCLLEVPQLGNMFSK